MEVLLGIQQLFTHSLEHKNWADETDSLTVKEGAWTHHRHQFFFFSQRELWDSKQRKYITNQLITKKAGWI